MASVAQIIIEVDQQGATKAFQQINAEAGKLGPNLQQVQRISESTFNNIEGGALKARESSALLGEEFGVHIPRALRGVLAQSTIIGPALTAAFNTLAIIGFVQILVNAAEQFGAFTSKIRDGGRDLIALEEAVTKTSRTMQGPQSFTEMAAQVGKTELRVAELRKELGLTGDFLPGLVAPVRRLGAEFNYSYLELQRLEKDLPGLQAQLDTLGEAAKRTEPVEILKLQNQARLAGLQGIAKINEEERGATAVLKAEIAARITHEAVGQAEITNLHAQTTAKRIEFERSLSDKTTQLRNQATLSGLTGLDAIREKATEEIDAERILYERGKSSWQAYQDAKIAISQRTENEINRATHDAAAQGQQAILQAEAAGASGRTAIERSYLAQIHQITMQEEKFHIVLDGERTAAKIEENHKLLELTRQRADEEIQIETEAAIAMLPPWQRADAQIVLAAEDRIRKIRELEAKDATFREQGEREVGAIMQKEWHDRVESMASQLEGLYNEITTGGLKQFFINRFKKLVFEMVAAWIVGMAQMRAASQAAMGGGGGGFLGAIFGALGLGGIFGGGGGGQGGVSSIPGVITNFAGGGGAPNASLGDLAGLGMASGMPSFSSGVGGGLSGSGETATEGGLGSALFGSLGLSAGGGAGSGTVLPSGAGASTGAGGLLGQLKGLLSSPALQGTAGLALLASSFGKGGLLAGLMGAAGGGLATFAALSPFLAAGPIGWLVVGIGALVGFLGGFFQKSTKKARLAIEANIKAQSQKLEDAYNSFQMDFPTSNTQLEALRQQGVDALKQAGVKDISRSRVGHVDQWVDKAEKEIAVTEAERVRRAAIAFGPAEFRVGGLVGPGAGGPVPSWFAGSAMHFAGGGAVPAFLHAGEYVMRPEAVSKWGRGRLDSMNSGGGGGATVEVHMHFPSVYDANGFEETLKKNTGGLLRTLRRASNEGML